MHVANTIASLPKYRFKFHIKTAEQKDVMLCAEGKEKSCGLSINIGTSSILQGRMRHAHCFMINSPKTKDKSNESKKNGTYFRYLGIINKRMAKQNQT